MECNITASKSYKPVKSSSGASLLWRYALVGLVVAFAGPPIYIHTPKVYGEIHGLNLAVLGGVLVMLRLLDFIQDPILGWAIARFRRRMPSLAALFFACFGLGMVGLFFPAPMDPIALWLGLSLLLVFTGFSGLQIMIYSIGLNLADILNTSHARVAAWRETAVLIGVSGACIVPVALALTVGEALAYGYYALIFLALLLLSYFFSRPLWHISQTNAVVMSNFADVFRYKNMRRIMALGFVNSVPTGVTSTLFLFYVEDRLVSDFHAGPMLLVFFLSAAIAAPLWGRLAAHYSVKLVLLTGMCLVIPAFILAAFLGEADFWQFYLICILSGAALGADMTLIPAILSKELSERGQQGAITFGLWGLITKMAFAAGAGIALIFVGRSGYVPGADNPESALRALAFTYALVPCLLKTIAIVGVYYLPLPKRPI